MQQSALGALYPIQLAAFSFSRQLTRVARSAETLFFYFFNCYVYFSSGFADDILNRCHVFIRALLIMLSTEGLAHDRAYISTTDAQPYMCGWDSL